MSSHHFVLEGQEPALIIEHPSPQNHPLLDQLLAWNPIVICTEQAIEAIQEERINWDYGLVSTPEAGAHYLQESDKQILISPQAHWGEEIGKILQKFACRSARLLTDKDAEFLQWEAMGTHFVLSVVTPNTLWIYVQKGSHRKWMPRNARLQLITRAESGIRCGNHIYRKEAALVIPRDEVIHVSSPEPFWWGEQLIG